MELEKQVVNFELSMKLDKLGVKRKSLWYWCDFFKGEVLPRGMDSRWLLYSGIEAKQFEGNEANKIIPAYTLAEVKEILPTGYASWREKDWCSCESGDQENYLKADTEANACAKMAIYLIKNNLLDVSTL